MRLFRMFATLAAACLAITPAHARSGQIALTFDDLPELSLVTDQSYVDHFTDDLLAGLRRHHLPATGFVVASKLDELDRAHQIAVLDKWLAAGHDLGNHTFSHDSPNELGPNAYIADIARDDTPLRELMAPYHRHPRWFRHPYLETGSPAAARRQIDDWLATHGYRVAPVTLVPSDYIFSEPYDVAVARHEDAHARRLRRNWLAYLQRSISWYRQAAHALFGRDIAYVLLLHANKLNADTIDDLAAILNRNQLKAVSLDKAMRDPAYRTHDNYTGKDGIDWVDRWSQTLKKSLPWDSFREPPAAVKAEYDKVDKDAENGTLDLDHSAPPAPEEPEATPASN